MVLPPNVYEPPIALIPMVYSYCPWVGGEVTLEVITLTSIVAHCLG